MRVKKPNPKISRQRIQFSHQRAERRRFGSPCRSAKTVRRSDVLRMIWPQVEPVIRRILRNQIQFLYSIRNQRLRLLRNVLKRPAAVTSPHSRNDAERAGMIATLGNLHIPEMPGCQPKPRWRKIRYVCRSGVDIDEGVRMGLLLLKFSKAVLDCPFRRLP